MKKIAFILIALVFIAGSCKQATKKQTEETNSEIVNEQEENNATVEKETVPDSEELSETAYDFELNGIYYNFIKGTADEVEVTYFIEYRYDDFDGVGDYYGDIVIPETIIYKNKQYHVTSIHDQTFRESSIESVTIPKSIRYIGPRTFKDCYLKKIEVQWQIPLNLREVEKKYPKSNSSYTSGSEWVAEEIFDWFEQDFERVILVVPANTKKLYQKQEVWKNFIHIEEKQ